AFKAKLLERTAAQRLGPGDDDDFGPVINQRQLDTMLDEVRAAREAGATILAGGERLDRPGYYMAPTLIEGTIAEELFGPISTLHRVSGFEEALELANDTRYGLTAAIWTASVHSG